MNTLEDRLDATCRMPDTDRRRLIAALNGNDRERSNDDTQRGHAVSPWFERVPDDGSPRPDCLAATSPARIWSWSYLRGLRDEDFVAGSDLRLPRVGWIAFMTAFIRMFIRMFIPKRTQAIGTYAGIVVDKPILDLLGISPETKLDLTTDGTSLVITPRISPTAARCRTAQTGARTLKADAGTFRKVAW